MHEVFSRPITRRATLSGLALAAVSAPLLTACSSSGTPTTGSTRDFTALDLDSSAGTEQTMTVGTDAGDVKVTYRQYDSIVYCLDPVDASRQSLTVRVPTALNGTTWDASGAPIIVSLAINGYTSATASDGIFGGDASSDGPTPGGSSAPNAARRADNGALALAAGFVVVVPGARGRDAQSSDKAYIGKAPAQIVDLKAVIRWIRHNAGRMPGDVDHIITTGSSSGGALSVLLGASGDSDLYADQLSAIGAAETSDAVFASAAYCPQTDIEHEDVIYEWTFGAQPYNGSTVDKNVSRELADGFDVYLDKLGLKGLGGYGALTADNYGDYLVRTHLQPAATTHLGSLPSADRERYLASNPWITWRDSSASFDFDDFLAHVGRSKPCPAIDQEDLSSAENGLFGDKNNDARHFTGFGLQLATGDDSARIDQDIPDKLVLMNPMSFLYHANPGRARNWFLRVGTSDTDTSPVVCANLAAITAGLGDNVDALMYWDAGHGANEDAAAFIAWVSQRTGFTAYSA